MCPWAWQRSKSPWSLALTVTDNQSEWRRGGIYPVGVMRFWAWQRSKSPWSLALTVTDNQSEGRRGGTLPCQSDVSLGLATLEKPQELSSHPD